MPEKPYWHSFLGHYLPYKDEKLNKDAWDWMMLLNSKRYVTDAFRFIGLFMSAGTVWSLCFPFLSSFSCSFAVKWAPLPLWGRVVLVWWCMNQSGDRAAGWMADATARMLFNQDALPSKSQGETLHRQIKEKGSSTPRAHAYCIHAGIHVHGPTLIPLISQGVTHHV